MPSIKIINYQSISGVLTGTINGTPLSLDGCQFFSCQVVSTLATPTAKTFASGVAALLAVQDITYTASTRGTAGNSITIAYTAGGTAGAEVVTVTGTAISVSIDVTPITGSTATQVKAAIDASGPAGIVIATITGTAGNVQAAAAAAPLATGVNSNVNTVADTITIAANTYTTGLKVRLTSTGTLPAGVTTGVDYFVIVVDANTFQLASSLALALAGTAIDLTSQGTSGATNTVTATALAGGTAQLQISNDLVSPTNWSNDGASQNITGTGVLFFPDATPYGIWARMVLTVTAGQVNVTVNSVVKGPN